jgi:integrase
MRSKVALDFKSDIAKLLTLFFEEKYRLGFKYVGIDAYIKSFDKFLIGKDCKDFLSKETILEWVKPKPHQKATTIEHNIHIMQRLADFLNRNGHPTYKVPSEMIPKRSHDFTPYIFTYDEIERIISVFDNLQYTKISPKKHLVYPLLIRVLSFCGLRVSEALNLKMRDIDFESGRFTLKNTKTYTDRIIPIDENLKERFCAYRKQMGLVGAEEFFFPTRNGSSYSIMTIEHTFRNALREAGIPYRGRGKGPRLHDLRHSFCVHSLQKSIKGGKDPYAALPVLMTYLGHKSVNATSRYIHLSAESYPALVKQTEALFGELIPLEDD